MVILAEGRVVHHGVAVEILALKHALKLGTHLFLCHRLVDHDAADHLDHVRLRFLTAAVVAMVKPLTFSSSHASPLVGMSLIFRIIGPAGRAWQRIS